MTSHLSMHHLISRRQFCNLRFALLLTLSLSLAMVCALLTACSGIPVSSIPRLLNLNAQLLDAKPAEFTIAIQIDARLTPPPGSAPVLEVTVVPNGASSFDDINKKIPLSLSDTGTGIQADTNPLAISLGLQAAPKGRRWLIYNFAPTAQAELVQIQNTIKKLISDKKAGSGPGRGGGKMSVGIAQDSMIGRDPAFASTRWESWVQTRKTEGLFELWSGTVGGLLKQSGLGRPPPTTVAPQK